VRLLQLITPHFFGIDSGEKRKLEEELTSLKAKLEKERETQKVHECTKSRKHTYAALADPRKSACFPTCSALSPHCVQLFYFLRCSISLSPALNFSHPPSNTSLERFPSVNSAPATLEQLVVQLRKVIPSLLFPICVFGALLVPKYGRTSAKDWVVGICRYLSVFVYAHLC
jgi:hypothetical protein